MEGCDVGPLAGGTQMGADVWVQPPAGGAGRGLPLLPADLPVGSSPSERLSSPLLSTSREHRPHGAMYILSQASCIKPHSLIPPAWFCLFFSFLSLECPFFLFFHPFSIISLITKHPHQVPTFPQRPHPSSCLGGG